MTTQTPAKPVAAGPVAAGSESKEALSWRRISASSWVAPSPLGTYRIKLRTITPRLHWPTGIPKRAYVKKVYSLAFRSRLITNHKTLPLAQQYAESHLSFLLEQREAK